MVNYDPHNKQRLTASEIALLDSQLPDIGGAVRGKPVTTDGNGWRVGSSTKISKSGRWFDFKAQQRVRRRLSNRTLPDLHAR
jgi:hypothetical protein